MFRKPLLGILTSQNLAKPPFLPSKSLLPFRASKLRREYSYFASVHDKQVTEDPTLIIFHLKRDSKLAKPPFFHTVESGTLNNNVLKATKKVGLLEFVDKKLLNRTCWIAGSCNGLMIIETNHKPMPIFTVIHPINKEYYVLPQLPSNFMLKPCNRESCGLGFDSSTNTFKMVCVYHNPNYPNCGASSAHCTMVHVFGTNSWHTIPQVPAYRIYGEAIFSHGCLHWLDDHRQDGERRIISFDVTKEEFGLIEPPQRNFHAQLVNLDGQVGYFDYYRTVWVLNDMKEWTLHCDIKDYEFDPEGYRQVVGCLNKDGDILIKVTNCWTEWECLYIYNLKNKVMHAAWLDGLDFEYGSKTEIVILPNSLCDINTNSNLFKKKSLKKT